MPDRVSQPSWNALGQERWGILANKVQGWKYVGDVQGGCSNASGIISYADGTLHAGGWFNDERDSFGKLTKSRKGGAVIEEGIYVKNVLRSATDHKLQWDGFRCGEATGIPACARTSE
jgi:hypothetical protein